MDNIEASLDFLSGSCCFTAVDLSLKRFSVRPFGLRHFDKKSVVFSQLIDCTEVDFTFVATTMNINGARCC